MQTQVIIYPSHQLINPQLEGSVLTSRVSQLPIVIIDGRATEMSAGITFIIGE